jgi:hypothetical protein
MVNSWIEHVKKFAKKNGLSYACAISNPDCKNSYKPKPKDKDKKKVVEAPKAKAPVFKPVTVTKGDIQKALEKRGKEQPKENIQWASSIWDQLEAKSKKK